MPWGQKELYITLLATDVSVCEERVDEASLKARAMIPLLRFMGRRGWTIELDPDTHKNYRCLSKWTRRGHKGDLQCMIQLRGRTLNVELWQDKYNVTHPHGGKYESRKRDLMPPHLRRRCDLEVSKLAAFLADLLGYRVLDQRHFNETADQRIAREYAECWHTKPELGRPAFTNGDWDRVSADRQLLEHGQTVWVRGFTGRWLRGQAFYRLNNMWLVKIGPQDILSKANFEVFAAPPMNPREKRHPLRKHKLQVQVKTAVAACDFLRAHEVHGVLTRHLAEYKVPA